MRLSSLPPLLVAVALLFGAASQYPGSAGVAMGAVSFLVLGAWLALEIGTEVVERWRRIRGKDQHTDDQHTDDPS